MGAAEDLADERPGGVQRDNGIQNASADSRPIPRNWSSFLPTRQYRPEPSYL
jgi:hypothetical protein